MTNLEILFGVIIPKIQKNKGRYNLPLCRARSADLLDLKGRKMDSADAS